MDCRGFNILPAAKRQFFMAEDAGMPLVCIQTKENSLGAFTAGDTVVFGDLKKRTHSL